ncbi:MAG TPA: hypothetical protein VES21_06715 [Nocardioidaceae bacterium]|nr:hypothetical protein [Nocardioidaceae bacterium]
MRRAAWQLGTNSALHRRIWQCPSPIWGWLGAGDGESPNDWEKAASLDLRNGRTDVIGTYVRHDRVREGTTEQMIDAAYAAWRADVRAGRASVLVTDATSSVIDLNRRARAERLLDGDTITAREVNLADGSQASAGDIVITRRNDRHLHTLGGGGWVRNGDRWAVASVDRDGSMRGRRSRSSPRSTRPSQPSPNATDGLASWPTVG